MKSSVENYWTANLLINLKNWQAISDGATEKLKKYDSVRMMSKDEMLSMKSKSRLFDAMTKRKMMEKMWKKDTQRDIPKDNFKMAGKRTGSKSATGKDEL